MIQRENWRHRSSENLFENHAYLLMELEEEKEEEEGEEEDEEEEEVKKKKKT